MIVSKYPKTAKNVINKIRELIMTYHSDMADFRHYSIRDMFDYIRTLRYIPDPHGTELIMRPKILLERGGGDCDDKTIMGCAYFVEKGIETGFSLVSDTQGKPYHHIFTIFKQYGKWYDFDATYPYNKFLERKKWAERVNFELSCGT